MATTAAKGLFVTGTDTHIGKTLVSEILMQELQDQGIRVQGMKPVATGCVQTSDGLQNTDALTLRQQSSRPRDYAVHNPYAFAPAIAPRIAAKLAGQAIEPGVIQRAFDELRKDGLVVVEGVGGWRVPLGEEFYLSDIPHLLGLAVVMVVGIRLGCQNHALLTAESIVDSGAEFVGWVANCLVGELEARQQIQELNSELRESCLGVIPYFGVQSSGIQWRSQGISLGSEGLVRCLKG